MPDDSRADSRSRRGGDRSERGDDRSGREDAGDDSGGLSLKLPPIRVPSFFPEEFQVLWPGGGDGPRPAVSPRTVAFACVAFDAVDALLALTVDAPLVAGARTVGGALAAAGAFGLLGLPYLWEPVAALLGFGSLTAFPTLSSLLVVRALR
jgi:hypothetical protein